MAKDYSWSIVHDRQPETGELKEWAKSEEPETWEIRSMNVVVTDKKWSKVCNTCKLLARLSAKKLLRSIGSECTGAYIIHFQRTATETDLIYSHWQFRLSWELLKRLNWTELNCIQTRFSLPLKQAPISLPIHSYLWNCRHDGFGMYRSRQLLASTLVCLQTQQNQHHLILTLTYSVLL